MFVSISFGPSSDLNKYWNYVTYHSSKYLAERWALDQKVIGKCIGYVVIEKDYNSWQIIDECGTNNVSVSQKGSFFTVQPAPKLVLV